MSLVIIISFCKFCKTKIIFKENAMDKEAAARIQSSEAKRNGGIVSKDSFAARAQRAANKNSNKKRE
ncbi:hypothetical protein AVBRAN12647_07965 [Campylobacter sp. RM12647]|nr:hypothetical protein [Campylobacter sp. RM12647]